MALATIHKCALVILGCMITNTPTTFALQPQAMATVLRAKLASITTETPTVLRFRDNVQDEEGIEKNLNSPLPTYAKAKEPVATGIQMNVIRNTAAIQLVSLLIAAGVTATALALSGHAPDLNALHWNDSENFRSLLDITDVNSWRLTQGVLAATPMIYLSKYIESLDKREISRVNFSTINMVMALFGRRAHSQQMTEHDYSNISAHKRETPMMHAMLFSIAIALATGISEEIIFRGMIPSAILFSTHSVPVAVIGQGILFGVAHQSPRATKGENNVVGMIQTLSGIWYGLVYLLAGGDIFPCIVAHILYDSHVLLQTWMTTNDQMDYTEKAVLQRLTKEDEKDVRKIKEEVGSGLSAETLAFLRRFFYAFDYAHMGTLSKSDVQRAITYAFVRDEKEPSEERVNDLFDRLLANRDTAERDDSSLHRLKLPEFLRMVLFIRANPSRTAS